MRNVINMKSLLFLLGFKMIKFLKKVIVLFWLIVNLKKLFMNLKKKIKKKMKSKNNNGLKNNPLNQNLVIIIQ